MSTRRLTTIAMVSCLAFIGRMMFTFLPNVQPMTVIIILITMYLGVLDGWLVATISLLISNIYMGMGVWTLAQIISYTILVLIVWLVGSIMPKSEKYLIFWCGLSGFLGILYGFIISLVQAPFFGWASFMPYWISGIPYDLYHAFGNFFFFMILHPILKILLTKHKTRM